MILDRDELRALQAPLKERYRDEPDAARVTLAASGELGEGVSCSVQTSRAIAEAGLHPATGGDGTQLCSGVTLRAVATAMGLDVRGGRVAAEGDLDFRGTLGVDRDARVGFTDIRLRFDLDTTESRAGLASVCSTTQ
jgi:hypothetical protein